MNEKQQAMLLSLIAEWTGIVDDAFSRSRTAEIKAGLDDTWFVWSGPTWRNGSSYYRIQGPKLFIELTQNQSVDEVNTIYRDPTNDYGQALRTR